MKRFQNIIFIKSQLADETALQAAVNLARHNAAQLTLIDIAPHIPDLSFYGLPDDTVREAELKAKQKQKEDLETLTAPFRDILKIKTLVLEGKPFLVIIQDVLRNSRDLVIKTAEGTQGLFSGLFSTTDIRLLRKCPCPVWLIKPSPHKTLKTIVAAIDFDLLGDQGSNHKLNKQIMEMSFSLAAREKAQLHIIHAWQAIGEEVMTSSGSGYFSGELVHYISTDVRAGRQKHMDDFLEQTKGWVGDEVFNAVHAKGHVIHGFTEQVISEEVKNLEADLLVMGTVGRTGIPGFVIGNTAEAVFNAAECSILALKPEGFLSPVTLDFISPTA